MSKFRDYDSLLSSYQQLEKKFTQKCQQLAQTHGTSEDTSPTSVSPPYTTEQFYNAYPDARQYEQQITQSLDSPNGNADMSTYLASYIQCLTSNSQPSSSTSQQCTDNVSLANITTEPLPTIIAGNNGNMSLAMPTLPKTIAQASELAKKIFE